MRRRRTKLQVNTFPFLAVLLGAMGSLIFLLLVMDRRAKITARNKLQAAQEAQLAATTDADRQRRDDWERQRSQLHDLLATQEQQVRSELQTVLGNLTQTGQQLQTHGEAQSQLSALFEAEHAKLLREQNDVRQRQAVLLKSVHLEETSKSELVRLTRELLELEQTLENYQRWKVQQQPRFSLVPFRGQRGENRQPIYVECTRGGLTFLPDRLQLQGADLDITRIRSEVERRHGPLVKAQRGDPFKAASTSEQPYVLFLIRPDGIGSYYRGQGALRGYQIDYGYELVDADWTLEVPAKTPPTTASFGPGDGGQAGGSLVPGIPSRGSGTGSTGPPGAQTGSGFVSGVPGGNQGFGSGNQTVGQGGVGGNSKTTPPGQGGASSKGLGDGRANTGNSAETPGAGKDHLGPGIAPYTAPGSLTGLGQGSPLSPKQTGQNRPGARGEIGDPGSVVFRPAQDQGVPAPPGFTPKIDGGPKDAAGAKPPVEPVVVEPDAVVKEPGTTVNGGSARQQQNGTSDLGNAIGRLAPPATGADTKEPRSSAPTLGRVVGNRDFIVTLACYEEGVLVTPGGASFSWNNTANVADTDAALVRAVTQIISRRQATVRVGEPPYRAVLRFEVHEQGRRTYHRVYPLLDKLRLPMVRENVQE